MFNTIVKFMASMLAFGFVVFSFVFVAGGAYKLAIKAIEYLI